MKAQCCALLILLLLAVVTPLLAADVEISGLTHQWQSGKYIALPKVKVVVSRNGSFVKSTQSDLNSTGDAEYKLRVASGEPIHVVFHLSKDYVPEMQSLSARDDDQHRVSSALMTVQQYEQLRHANPSLPTARQRVECISRFVPRESPLFNEIMDMLKQID